MAANAGNVEAVSDTLLNRTAKRQYREAVLHGLSGFAAVVSLIITVLIIASLFWEAGLFLYNLGFPSETIIEESIEVSNTEDVNFGLLSDTQWSPRRMRFDIKTLLYGSLVVTAVAMTVAGPLGFGAAVYLSEYARPRVRKFLKPVLEVLAGIPSIVIAFFALQFISPNIVGQVFPDANGQNLIVAGLGVGLLTIPLVASISEDALRSVPQSLRQASAGMGARKMRTSLSVVAPAAISGLVAALIVGVSRAIGETMVVFVAAGGSGNAALFETNPLEKGSTMTAAMASQAKGSDAIVTTLGASSLFFVGALLFLITLTLNVVADRFVQRVRQKY